jgi:hypothetical protein
MQWTLLGCQTRLTQPRARPMPIALLTGRGEVAEMADCLLAQGWSVPRGEDALKSSTPGAVAR